MPSKYSSFAILVLTGVFFLGFRTERNIRNHVVRFEAGTSPSSEINDSAATVSFDMISFEDWLLLHKLGHSE